MTFADIVDRVAKRLNLTSPEAMTRIAEGVNDRYRQLAASINMQTSVRQVVTQAATVGDRFITFEDVEKLYTVFDANVTPSITLLEVSVDEMRDRSLLGTQPSRQYATWRQTANTITLMLDAAPTSAYVYSADAQVINATLIGSDEPAFPESFHDLLVFGGMSEELFKMEKYDKADRYDARYQERLGELRLHLASSSTRELWQGQASRRARWYW